MRQHMIAAFLKLMELTMLEWAFQITPYDVRRATNQIAISTMALLSSPGLFFDLAQLTL